ncbi:MAG: hypothetical protein RJA36_2851 [Pseudomonadota bacterium]|jgi:hypothetical protein
MPELERYDPRADTSPIIRTDGREYTEAQKRAFRTDTDPDDPNWVFLPGFLPRLAAWIGFFVVIGEFIRWMRH